MSDSHPSAKPEIPALVLFWLPLVIGGVAKLVAGAPMLYVQGAAGVVVAIVSLGGYFARRGRRFARSYLFVSLAWLVLGCLLLGGAPES